MHPTTGVLLLLLGSNTILTSASCNSTSQCNEPYGHCQDGKCFCSYFHSGSNCENDWKEDTKFSIVFWTYDALVLCAHFIYVVLFAYQLFITFQYAYEGGWTTRNVTTIALFCELFGSLARVALFAGDPQGYRKIYPFELVEVLFTISLLLYLNAGMLLVLNLIELMQQQGIEKLAFLRKYRWCFIVFSFCMTVVVTLIALWRVMSNLSAASVNSYNITFAIALFLVLGVDIVLGITVFKEVRIFEQISNQLSGTDVKVFLWKLLRFTMITTLAIIVGLMALVVYTVYRGDTDRWAWLALNATFRAVEVLLLQQFYVLVRKKIPEESEASTVLMTSRSLRANTLA